jgi:DNA-directed RNA polymerase subunit F
MIRKFESLSMAETLMYLDEKEENQAEVIKFIKKFVKISPEEAQKIRKKISELGNIKIKDEHISKIIDLLPEDSESINKIFTDVSLDENETKELLKIISEFKQNAL